jgi:hypothetical protein
MTSRSMAIGLVLLSTALAYGGDLRRTNESREHWKGEYKDKKATISYDSKCSSQKCELELRLGPHKVRATRLLYGDDDVSLRFGGLKMTEAYRDALIEVEQLTHVDAYLGPAEMLLHSIVTMLQEAPIGWTMEDMDMKRPPGTPIQREVFPMSEEEMQQMMGDGAPGPTPTPHRHWDELNDEEKKQRIKEEMQWIQEDEPNGDVPWPTQSPMSSLQDPRYGDCVVDPLGARRPRHLFMHVLTCSMNTWWPNSNPNASSTSLPCYPLRGQHSIMTYHDAERGPLMGFVCGSWSSLSNQHCMQGYFLPYGTQAFDRYACRSNTCPGRCGLGCGAGISGYARYTYECLNHDYAVGSHRESAINPYAANSGDEYQRAAPSYTFGWLRYGGC